MSQRNEITDWLDEYGRGYCRSELLYSYHPHKHIDQRDYWNSHFSKTRNLWAYTGGLPSGWNIDPEAQRILVDGFMRAFAGGVKIPSVSLKKHMGDDYNEVMGQQQNDVLNWLLFGDKNKNVPSASGDKYVSQNLHVLTEDWCGIKKGSIIHFRKTEDADIGYWMPFFKIDQRHKRLDFEHNVITTTEPIPYLTTEKAGPNPVIYHNKPPEVKSVDLKNSSAAKTDITFGNILDSLVEIAAASASTIPKVGAPVSAIIKEAYKIFNPHPNKRDILNEELQTLRSNIKKDIQKLNIDQLIDETNAYWHHRFNYLNDQYLILKMHDEQGTTPDKSHLTKVIKELTVFATGGPGDVLAVNMGQLLSETNWMYTYPSYIAGANIEILSWITILGIQSKYDLGPVAKDDIREFLLQVRRHSSEVMNLMWKLRLEGLMSGNIKKSSNYYKYKRLVDTMQEQVDKGYVNEASTYKDWRGVITDDWSRSQMMYIKTWGDLYGKQNNVIAQWDRLIDTMNEWL